MKRIPFLFLLACIAWLGAIVPVYAKEDNAELQAVRLYDVSWQGITIGTLTGEVRENGDHYTFRAAIRALNIADSLTHYRNDSTTLAYSRKGELLPVSFSMQSQLRKKKKQVKLAFDEAGIITSEEVSHPANPLKVKPISHEMKQGSVDPLTAALRAREQVRRYLAYNGEGQFIIPVYEGRHLFMVYFSLTDAMIKVKGKEVPVIHLHFFRKPLGGFSEKELKDMAKETDPILEVYLSRDDLLLPIQAEAITSLGKVKAVLKQECTTWEECVK